MLYSGLSKLSKYLATAQGGKGRCDGHSHVQQTAYARKQNANKTQEDGSVTEQWQSFLEGRVSAMQMSYKEVRETNGLWNILREVKKGKKKFQEGKFCVLL